MKITKPTADQIALLDIRTIAREFPKWARTDEGIAALLEAAENRLMRDLAGSGDHPE